MRLITALFTAAVAAGPALAADREVSINGGAAPLSGSLLTPQKPTPGPAVLLIAGSGPTDRDGDTIMAGSTPATLKLIAQALAQAGRPSLRYDKRGVGASAAAIAAEADMRFTTAVDDAVLFAKILQAEPGVTCVVILGHSEGALIAALAAQKFKTCGLISVSGVGRPLGKVLREQLAAQPLPPALAAQIETALVELEAGRQVASIPGLEALFRPSVQPYLISQLTLDPVTALKAVPVPVLIVQGDNDIQVGVSDARLLSEGRPEAKLVILPGVNHVLKTAPADRAGNIATYRDAALPLAPGVMEAILPFVAAAKP